MMYELEEEEGQGQRQAGRSGTLFSRYTVIVASTHRVIVIAIAGVVIAIATLHLPRRHNERRQGRLATFCPFFFPGNPCPDSDNNNNNTFTHSLIHSDSVIHALHSQLFNRALFTLSQRGGSWPQLQLLLPHTTHCFSLLKVLLLLLPLLFLSLSSVPFLAYTLSCSLHTFALINQHFQFMALV